MKKVNILVFAGEPAMLQSLIRLVEAKDNWSADGSTDEEKVIELFYQYAYDLMLMGGKIPEAAERKVRALIRCARPNFRIIRHYDGGSELLNSELEAALWDSSGESFWLTDDPFSGRYRPRHS